MQERNRRMTEQKWTYIEPDEYGEPVHVVVSRQDILDIYWKFWKNAMDRKYGEGHELTTEDNCVEDFVVCNFAMPWDGEDNEQ
jgi:hypothetical protein